MITGAGPEVLVTVEDIEDLDLHIGQLAGHEENYVSIGYMGNHYERDFPGKQSNRHNGTGSGISRNFYKRSPEKIRFVNFLNPSNSRGLNLGSLG